MNTNPYQPYDPNNEPPAPVVMRAEAPLTQPYPAAPVTVREYFPGVNGGAYQPESYIPHQNQVQHPVQYSVQPYQPIQMPGYQGYYPQGMAVMPPQFALGNATGDPLIKGATRIVNLMCMLMIFQTVAAFFWEILLAFVMTTAGVNIFTDTFALLWLTTAIVPLSTALPFVIYLRVQKSDISDFLKFKKVGFTAGVACVMAGLGVCMLANYPAVALQDFLRGFGYEPASGADLMSEVTWPGFALEMFTTAILVPVMEELAFRGVITSALRKYGVWFSIVVSALMFGLAHLDVANVLFASIAGLAMGVIYAYTQNLWICIAVHALNNGISVISSHTGFLFGEEMGTIAQVLLMLVPIVLGIFASVYLFMCKKNTFVTAASPEYDGPHRSLRFRGSALSVVSSPVFWGVFAMMICYTAFRFIY